jgi:hypothetical protein
MFGITIGRRAQALAAALAIGTVVLGFAPGEAHARDNGGRCWSYDPDTDMHNFYLPGESIWVGRTQYQCHVDTDGDYWRTVPERSSRGGVRVRSSGGSR